MIEYFVSHEIINFIECWFYVIKLFDLFDIICLFFKIIYMNRIYCALGKIVEVTQNIEIDIGEIIEKSEIIKEFSRHVAITQQDYDQVVDDAKYLREKMESMTFGQMIGIVYESKSLSHDEINDLKALLEKRNYFTHEYFKFTKFGSNPKDEFIIEEFEALKVYLGSLKKMLSRLEMIKSGQVDRLEYLIQKNKLNA